MNEYISNVFFLLKSCYKDTLQFLNLPRALYISDSFINQNKYIKLQSVYQLYQISYQIMIGRQRCKSSLKKRQDKKKSKKDNCNKKVGQKEKQAWKNLLSQIESLTHKIQKVSSSENNKKYHSNRHVSCFSQTQRMEQISEREEYPIESPYQNFISQNLERKKGNCSSNCHRLVEDYEEIVKKNRKLMQINEQLQKKIYFESKQKRQLRWKLEKIEKRDKIKVQKGFMNYSENIDLFENINSSTQTVSHKDKSHRQQSLSTIRNKLKKEYLVQTDELVSEESERLKNKQNNEFLQLFKVCTGEKDAIKKAFIKRQMKSIAQKLKKIKPK